MENIFQICNDDTNFWLSLRCADPSPFNALPHCTGQSEEEVIGQLHVATRHVASWRSREIDQQTLTAVLTLYQVDELLHNLTSNASIASSTDLRCIYADGSEYVVHVQNNIISQVHVINDFVKFMHVHRPFVAIGILLNFMGYGRARDAWRAGGVSAVTPEAARIYGGLVGLG